MTDTAGIHRHTGLHSPRVTQSSAAFARAFGDVRPFAPPRELAIAELDAVPGRSRLLVQLLHNRGVSGAEGISTFLEGDWHARGTALLHLDRATDRIRRAIHDGERIVVFGDFDCDGITSCVLLTSALRGLGAQVTPYVPQRDDDGRGLNPLAVRQLADAGASLIITTDCGTANVTEIEVAQASGMDVIVTDHHPPLGPLAQAYAVVNPRQDGDESCEQDLAGVGVAFRLAEELVASGSAAADLLDLVAIGTIADMVSLTPTNWALVHAGLQRLNAAPRPGIRALLAKARVAAGSVMARDISFSLAPRINACGRIGRSDLAVELLLAENAAEAERLAEQVEALNMERQRITDQIVAAAREQALAQRALAAPMLLVQGERWPLGVLGLVAGRLAEEYRRPVFVISRGVVESRGSARGPAGLHLGEALAARAEFFTRFGGHAQAAGFTLPTARLPELEEYLVEHFAASNNVAIIGEETEGRDAHPVAVDCRLALRRLEPGSDIYTAIELLEPFGPGFPEPTFLCPGARILECRRSGAEGRTLRLRLSHGEVTRELVWSRQGDLCDRLRTELKGLPLVDVIYTPRRYRKRSDGEPEWLAHIETLAPAQS